MGVELNTKEKEQVKVFYVNSPVPCTVEENFDGHLHDHGDLTLAEVLQDQESVFQSLQANTNEMGKVSSHTAARSDDLGEAEEEKFSLTKMSIEAQVAMDENIARELQEIENRLDVTLISENTETEVGDSSVQSSRVNVEGNSSNTIPQQGARQDNVNPDNMTYEELQSLGEAIGTECRGLSDELISYLPTSTYKTGLFSKKEKQECVICCMAYKNRAKLIKLPCQHQYHERCITPWLKINKACPICTEEVFGS